MWWSVYLFRTSYKYSKAVETDGKIPPKLELLVNIAGLPLFKSSGLQLWPILYMLQDSGVFPVAIFCGNSKPDCWKDYAEWFIH